MVSLALRMVPVWSSPAVGAAQSVAESAEGLAGAVVQTGAAPLQQDSAEERKAWVFFRAA